MTENTPIRVLIVDDHDMLREGLAVFLNAHSDLLLVGEAASGAEAVSLCASLLPDVILMDIVMPEMDGISAIHAIHDQYPKIRIIALTSFSEDELVRAALRAGASGYLLKSISADKLADAIRSANAGFLTLTPDLADKLLAGSANAHPGDCGPGLTQREQEVLAHIVKGLSNAEISMRLDISKYTVKNHVSRILEKLGAASRTEAVSLALQKKLVR